MFRSRSLVRQDQTVAPRIPFSDLPRQRFGPPDGDAVWVTVTRENDLSEGWAVGSSMWWELRRMLRHVTWSLRLSPRHGWTVAAYSGRGDQPSESPLREQVVADQASAEALASAWRDELAP
jgi:hypothetical protein